MKRQPVGCKKILIETIGHGGAGKARQRILLQVGKPYRGAAKMGKAGTAHQNTPDLTQPDGNTGLFNLKGRRDNSEIRPSLFHIRKNLSRRAVADTDLHIGMLLLKLSETVQQQTVQGGFRCPDADGAAVEAKGQAKLFLTAQNPFAGRSHIAV